MNDNRKPTKTKIFECRAAHKGDMTILEAERAATGNIRLTISGGGNQTRSILLSPSAAEQRALAILGMAPVACAQMEHLGEVR